MVVNTIRGLILKYAKDSPKRGTEREDMEKAFPPVLSNLNLVVVAGYGPVEKCRARGQHNINHGAKAYLLSPRDNFFIVLAYANVSAVLEQI